MGEGQENDPRGRVAVHRRPGHFAGRVIAGRSGGAGLRGPPDPRPLHPELRRAEARSTWLSLGAILDDEFLYRINGNTLGNQYSLTKLKWIKEHQPELYARTYKFLHWSSFVAFMLGADPFLDYSLANRTLLFDVDRTAWSEEMLARAGLDRDKLPDRGAFRCGGRHRVDATRRPSSACRAGSLS